MEKFIDLSNVPKSKSGKRYNWQKVDNVWCSFEYGTLTDKILLVSCENGIVTVEYNKNRYDIPFSYLLNCNLGTIREIREKSLYKYNIGDLVNTYEIIDKFIKEGVVYYTVKCINDGYTKTIEQYYVDKQGCAVCSNKKVVKGINDIATTNPEMAIYFLNIKDTYSYTYSSTKKKLPMKCPICGYVKYMYPNELYHHGFCCNKCSDGISYPNKFMANVLSELHVDYICEYSPDWANGYRYDFFFKYQNKNIVIEVDGAFHFITNAYSGMTSDESQKIDNIKEDLAYKNGIDEIIRINALKSDMAHIKNSICKSSLSSYFDLSVVNFDFCDIQSNLSLIKKASDLWNSGEHDTSIIASKLNISRRLVTTYLNKSVKLGMSDYSKTVALSEAGKKNHKFRDSIQVIFNGESYIFKSKREFERNSKTLTGHYYSNAKINKNIQSEEIDKNGIKISEIHTNC